MRTEEEQEDIRIRFIEKLTIETKEGKIKWKQFIMEGQKEYSTHINDNNIILYQTIRYGWILSMSGKAIISKKRSEIKELIDVVESGYDDLSKELNDFLEEYTENWKSNYPLVVETEERGGIPASWLTWRRLGYIVSFGLIKSK
jgi:hypothetical protein